MWDWALKFAVSLWEKEQAIIHLSPGQSGLLPDITVHIGHNEYTISATVTRK